MNAQVVPHIPPPAEALVDRPTIAVDIDDTLNDFTQTLRSSDFPFDPAYGLPEEAFRACLEKVRNDTPEPGDLLSTEYSYFRYRIHEQCYGSASDRPGAVEFMRWLRSEGWRIVICTRRDLRRANTCTRAWLADRGVPFDHLFMAANKIAFCKAWGIRLLIDDEPFHIEHGGPFGVQVFYPLMDKHASLPPHSGRGFVSFDEVKSWIRASSS